MMVRPCCVMLAALIGFCTVAMAETVHQTVPSGKMLMGDGSSALKKGKLETKASDAATDKQVARIKGDMPQWGYVACWFGLPAPQGKVIVRIRVLVDDQKAAKYLLYTKTKTDQVMIGELKLPADAAAGTFVNVDVPVNSPEEWSGLIIKKAEKSELPSPWIDTVSIVLPD